jgi:hypothetical protein
LTISKVDISKPAQSRPPEQTMTVDMIDAVVDDSLTVYSLNRVSSTGVKYADADGDVGSGSAQQTLDLKIGLYPTSLLEQR